MSEPRFWIGVASAEHCRRGVAGGFVQLGHGKSAPIRALSPGDGIVLYAPREGMREGPVVRAFVGVGIVEDGEPYSADMGGGFVPTRRAVRWDRRAADALIQPLLGQLSFSEDRPNWGLVLRRGALIVTREDFALICTTMGSQLHIAQSRERSC
jgi:hypothetical protein